MERITHRLLLAWVLLWGASIFTQVLPFPGSARLGYWFFVVVVLTSPVIIVLQFLSVVLGLCEALHRLCVLRRAVKWKRKEPRAPWPGEE
jgi:hypothetical protein